MSNGKPNGQLTTGGVGGFLFGGGVILVSLGGAAGGGGGGILGLLGILLIVGGGICHGIGYMGLGTMFGGLNKLGGTFAIIYAISAILLFLFPLMMGLDGMMIGGILFAGAALLYGIFGGLAHLGSAGKSDNGSLLQIAGILNLVGAVGALPGLFALLGIALPAFLTYFMFALAVGAILGGVGMMAQRG